MRFLPVFLDLTEGVVGLVGAGPAALNKLRLLRSAGARVRWYSKDAGVAEEVLTAALSGPLEICFADPRQADFTDCIAVVSAAGDALDDDIAALARSQHVPVNVVDRPELSTFIFPAIVDRGDVVVAIGTGGTSPVLARRCGTHRSAAAGADRRSRRLDGPLPGARRAGAARRALAAAVLGARGRRPDRRRGAGRALARCRAGADARYRTWRRHAGAIRCCLYRRRRPGRRRSLDVAGFAGAAGRRHRVLRRVRHRRNFGSRAPRSRAGIRRQAQRPARYRPGRHQSSVSPKRRGGD